MESCLASMLYGFSEGTVLNSERLQSSEVLIINDSEADTLMNLS